MPGHYRRPMSTRRPVNHPFAVVRTQGREVPALVLAWVKGAPGQPDDWFAQVVINSINEPGHAVEMTVAAKDIRPANP